MAGTFAHGSVLTLTAPAAGAVLNVVNMGLSGWSADMIEVTDHNSTDKYREFIQGIRDGGEMPVECNYVKTEAIKVQTAFNAGTVMANCTLVLPSAAGTLTFNCICSGAPEIGSSHDDKLTLSFTLKITGKPVLS